MSIVKKIFKNTAWLFAADIFNKAVLFGLSIYIARALGPDQFGLYGFALSFGFFFTILADLGLNTLLVRELAKDKSKTNVFVKNALGIKILCSTISFILLALITYFSNQTGQAKLVIYTFGLYSILTSINTGLRNIFIAYEEMHYDAWMTILERATILVAAFLFLQLGYQLLAVAVAFNLAVILTILTTIILLITKKIYPLPTFNPKDYALYLLPALPFALTTAVNLIYFKVDTLMLAFLQNNTQVGLYNAGFQIIEGLAFVPIIFMFSLFPLMSKFSKHDQKGFRITLNKAIKILTIIAIPITVIGIFFHKQIINIIYGAQYQAAEISFVILLLSGFLMYINKPVSYAMGAADKQTLILKITAITSVINIILNTILIPKYSHAGAAAATLISEIILFVYFYKYAYEHMYKIQISKLILKPILVTLPLLIPIYFLREYSLLITVPLFGLFYLVILIITKVINKHDIQLAKELIKKAP